MYSYSSRPPSCISFWRLYRLYERIDTHTHTHRIMTSAQALFSFASTFAYRDRQRKALKREYVTPFRFVSFVCVSRLVLVTLPVSRWNSGVTNISISIQRFWLKTFRCSIIVIQDNVIGYVFCSQGINMPINSPVGVHQTPCFFWNLACCLSLFKCQKSLKSFKFSNT